MYHHHNHHHYYHHHHHQSFIIITIFNICPFLSCHDRVERLPRITNSHMTSSFTVHSSQIESHPASNIISQFSCLTPIFHPTLYFKINFNIFVACSIFKINFNMFVARAVGQFLARRIPLSTKQQLFKFLQDCPGENSSFSCSLVQNKTPLFTFHVFKIM